MAGTMGLPTKQIPGVGNFGICLIVAEVIILGLSSQMDYDLSSMTSLDMSSLYNFYVGVALMMLVGFGYLMTFLRAYGLGAIGLTMLITCLGVQWALVVENAMAEGTLAFKIDLFDVMNAMTAVAAVLISFGGFIGKVSPTQLVVVTIVELTIYCANKVFFLTNLLDIADCGGTIIIHVFGAYFGLAACRTIGAATEEEHNAPSYVSDLFSLIGTVFLWLFWPSFVAGMVPAGTAGHALALLNTVLALLASTVTTFALVPFLSQGKLAPVPIQNAVLAGGVSIGATANFALGPLGAMIIGCIAGAISTVGFCRPLISSAYDTCGINNLHGMPGIFGGIVSIVLPFILKDTKIVALHQFLGLVGTLAIAGTTGAGTGYLLKALGNPSKPFHDAVFWEVAEDIPGGDLTESLAAQEA